MALEFVLASTVKIFVFEVSAFFYLEVFFWKINVPVPALYILNFYPSITAFFLEAIVKALVQLVGSANSTIANLLGSVVLLGHLGPYLILISMIIPHFY
jgi:hypothetical protein